MTEPFAPDSPEPQGNADETLSVFGPHRLSVAPMMDWTD
jgi:hypothetical protein